MKILLMHRFLPFVALFIITVVLAINYTPFKRELSYRGGPIAEIAYKLGLPKDATTSCCNEAEIINATGDFNENATTAIFNNEEIDYPKTSLANLHTITQNSAVLGTTNSAGEEKWIDVSLDNQWLRAMEGDKVIMEFPISSGLWGRTPKGTYEIWYKTRSQSMIGGSKELGTYYNLPNVPHNMFFYKGYAIHGAYWHNNFGTPMSHGCVNAPLAQVGQLFEWAGPVVPADKNYVRASAENPGTKVFIH